MIILHITILQVLSLIMMICAAVVTGAVNDVEDHREEVEGSDEYENAGSYRSAAGWLIFVAIMAMIIEITVIIIRFLNISFIRLHGIIFRITVSYNCDCLQKPSLMAHLLLREKPI